MTTSFLVTITNSKNVDCDPTFEASCSSSEAGLLTQEDSNDFVRDFNLSKTSWTLRFSTKRVETSPPKYWNTLLSPSPTWIRRIFLSRKRYDVLKWCLRCGRVSWTPTQSNVEPFVYWRFKSSFKSRSLYNGNKFPSVPLAHSVNIKESCGNMKLLSEKIQ